MNELVRSLLYQLQKTWKGHQYGKRMRIQEPGIFVEASLQNDPNLFISVVQVSRGKIEVSCIVFESSKLLKEIINRDADYQSFYDGKYIEQEYTISLTSEDNIYLIEFEPKYKNPGFSENWTMEKFVVYLKNEFDNAVKKGF